MKEREGGFPQVNWRYRVGLTLLVLACLTVLAGVGILLFGSPGGESAGWTILLLAGLPEILCLFAVGILGKENYQVLEPKIKRVFRQPVRMTEVSRLRYYSGLAGCLLNGVPLFLYAYVPDIMPGGFTRISLLVVADVVFLGSLLFAGGELWEKFRRIFIWEGNPPSTIPA